MTLRKVICSVFGSMGNLDCYSDWAKVTVANNTATNNNAILFIVFKFLTKLVIILLLRCNAAENIKYQAKIRRG